MVTTTVFTTFTLFFCSASAIFATLAPGILNNIFDGIERPLKDIAEQSGIYISRGVSVDSLDTNKKYIYLEVNKNGT